MDDSLAGAGPVDRLVRPAAPKRCEPCRATGAVHCSDPENCGGPWDKMHDAPLPAAEPTPGPWTLYRSERFSEWYVNQEGGPGYVCTMPWFEHRQAQCEANAKLVAAAPSLAQRLADLVACYSMDGVPNDSVPAFDAAMQLLRDLGHPLPTWLRA